MGIGTSNRGSIAVRLRPALGRASRAALVAVWCALTIGFIEVAILLFRQQVIGHFAFVGREFVWMTPISYLFHLWWVCAIAVLIASMWARAPLHYVVVLPLAFIGAFSQLIEIHQLHTVAVHLLALGIAVQVAGWVGRRPEGFQRLVRWMTPAMVGLLVIAASAVAGGRAWRERNGYAALPSAPVDAPNVLLIILDTVRAANLSLYGYERPTVPLLERWARGGVLFDNAYAPAPWTLPSHATLFTGRYPHELSTGWLSPMDERYPTLAEVFRRRGYKTAGFSANPLYAGYETGVDRGFIHFEDHQVSSAQVKWSSSLGQMLILRRLRRNEWRRHNFDRKWSADVNEHFLGWLDQRPDHRPFFAFLNYYDAHGPYGATPRFLRQIGVEGATPQERYDGGIARIDHFLGALLDSLQHRGILKNTIVLVTSDHGEQFGEHNLIQHGNSLYSPLLHVPLMVVWPKGVPTAVRVAEPVTLRDVPATLLDLAGAASGSEIPGTSLARLWADTAARPLITGSPILSMVQEGIRTPPEEPVTRGDMWSLVEGRWHYILNGDGAEELYDLVEDPGEARDLAKSDPGQRALESLRHSISVARRRVDSGLTVRPGAQ